MPAVSVRPDVAELVFRVYDWSFHPELIDGGREISIAEPGFRCRIRLHDAGHMLEFRYEDRMICEVVAASTQPLPTRRLRADHRLRGSRDMSLLLGDDLHYQSCLQVERLEPELFQNFHQELQFDMPRASLSREIAGGHRFATPAISLLRTEVGRDSFLLHAYHTFPDNSAVVKTQTLIEFAAE